VFIMIFQKRDLEICMAIYRYGGMLPLRLILSMFWPDAKTPRAAQKRIAKLAENEYLNRPTKFQWRTKPIPEAFCTNGWRGILKVAEHQGVVVPSPKNSGENQMRELEKALRKKGIRWVRQPKWHQLLHDIQAIDFRIAVEKSVEGIPSMFLDAWINEGEFRAHGDEIEYTLKGPGGLGRRAKKKVIPDGYFALGYRFLDQDGVVRRSKDRFLLEIDGGTHHLERFGHEKVVPGFEYVINSPEYKNRFGHNSGLWLVVTTGEQRMKHLKEKTEELLRGNAIVFLFSYFKKLEKTNLLLDAVWWQGGRKREPRPMIDQTLLWGDDGRVASDSDESAPAVGGRNNRGFSGMISL
jgi:hypothetical protein